MKMSLTDLPNNPMNFTENQHGNVVLDKLKLQKERGRFCDVTLYVKDRQFRAHRNILASCSPYFDSILKTHRTVKERLTITCQNSDIFQCLLNYIYTGSIVIDKNNVSELLRLANHFLVIKLKGYCGEYLDRYLDLTNCLTVRDMAEKYNMPVLSKAATMFVQIHLNKIIHGDELLGLPLHKIESFLSSKCWSIPQQLLLSMVARWISRDVPSRERNMRCLLAFVNWNALDGSVISEHVDREPLYSNSETCLYVVLQTLVENNLLFPKYQGIYQALQDKFSQFPILRPAGWRMYERTKRLIAERHGAAEERRLRQHQARKQRTAATLIGHIGRTFRQTEKETNDPFSVNTAGHVHAGKLLGLNPHDKDNADSKWCYDTPGTVQPDQVINLLTTEELMLTLPKSLLHPRTFSLTPGRTLLIAGLGRLDYVWGSAAIRFTVFASDSLPLTVVRTRDADEVYSALIGSELLAVPCGGQKRLSQWPGLDADKRPIELTGEDWCTSCADVVLSSAGWVAVTPGPGMVVELRAWTPAGRGVFVRPPLLRYSVNHRGARLRRSPAYKRGPGISVQ